MAAVRRRAPAKISEIEIYGYKTSDETLVENGDDTVDAPTVTETELLLY